MIDVAVIIPLYNGSRWIRKTLESVFSQTHLPKEVIVIDDGSKDNSIQIVSEFESVTLVNNPLKGANLARNFGFTQTTSPLVAFLDQDDIWHPDHLKLLSQILEQNPDAPAAIANHDFFSKDEEINFFDPVIKVESYLAWDQFPSSGIYCPSAVLIRRESLESIGGWVTRFEGLADMYTWYRLALINPLLKNQGFTAAYRTHHNSYSYNLRLNKMQEYSKTMLLALQELIDYRALTNPKDKVFYQNYLTYFELIIKIFQASYIDDLDTLTKEILLLEQSLFKESDKLVEGLMEYFCWSLLPTLSVGNNFKLGERLLSNICIQWPLNSRVIYRAFVNKIIQLVSIKFFSAYLASSPLRLDRWLLFRDVIKLRVKVKLPRKIYNKLRSR